MNAKKGHDDHLLQVIAEVSTENDPIDPVLLPTNQGIDTEYAGDESDELLELLGTLDEDTVAMFNATKSLTESKYIEKQSKQSRPLDDLIPYIVSIVLS